MEVLRLLLPQPGLSLPKLHPFSAGRAPSLGLSGPGPLARGRSVRATPVHLSPQCPDVHRESLDDLSLGRLGQSRGPVSRGLPGSRAHDRHRRPRRQMGLGLLAVGPCGPMGLARERYGAMCMWPSMPTAWISWRSRSIPPTATNPCACFCWSSKRKGCGPASS